MKTLSRPIPESQLTGTVGQVNSLLEQNPELFPELFREMMYNPKPAIRLRAGNAVEKAARQNPELLLPFKTEILVALPEMADNEIIWHVALLLGYLKPEDDDLALAVNKLFHWLHTLPHKFAKINCLQTLAVLARENTWLQPEVLEELEAATRNESPAIQARARILLKKYYGRKKGRKIN